MRLHTDKTPRGRGKGKKDKADFADKMVDLINGDADTMPVEDLRNKWREVTAANAEFIAAD